MQTPEGYDARSSHVRNRTTYDYWTYNGIWESAFYYCYFHSDYRWPIFPKVKNVELNRNLPGWINRRTPRENIPYICDFSRGGLNIRLSARIQTLLRGHRYRVYFLWGFCLFRSDKFIKRFGEEDRRMSLPGKLNFEGLTQKSIRKNYYFYTLK